MVKNREINGTEEISLVTPNPGLYDFSRKIPVYLFLLDWKWGLILPAHNVQIK